MHAKCVYRKVCSLCVVLMPLWLLIIGVLWNISNIFALLAIPIVGYAIAYPMMQCAILVAGVWGVVVFKVSFGCLGVCQLCLVFILLCLYPRRTARKSLGMQ